MTIAPNSEGKHFATLPICVTTEESSTKITTPFGRYTSDFTLSQEDIANSAAEAVNTLCMDQLHNISENDLVQLISPRTLLDRMRTKQSKPLFETSQNHTSPSGEECFSIMHSKSNYPISLQDNLNCSLELEEYEKIRRIKKSKRRSFNLQMMSNLRDSLSLANLKPIEYDEVNTIIKNCIKNQVQKIALEERLLHSKTISHFHAIVLKITHEVFNELVQSDTVFQMLPIQYNLLCLKKVIDKTVQTQKHPKRSDWLDAIVYTFERIIKNESTRGFTFYQSESVTNYFTFLIHVLQNQIDIKEVYSLFLRVFHSDRETAEKVIDQCLYWMTPRAFPHLTALVESELKIYCYHPNIQNRIFTFKDETHHLIEKLYDVDQEQVARSYFMDNQQIHDTLQVNDIDIHAREISGDLKDSQKLFFFRFFKQLYASGLCPSTDDAAITNEVDKFLSRRGNYIGKEILFLGSMNAWAICDEKLRTLYPLLFTTPYNTRLLNGIECYIQVESAKKYSLLIEKKYCTYPLVDPNDKESFAIDQMRPLIQLKVCWQLNYEKKQLWNYTISTPVVERLKASDEEFKNLLDLLMYPFPIQRV